MSLWNLLGLYNKDQVDEKFHELFNVCLRDTNTAMSAGAVDARFLNDEIDKLKSIVDENREYTRGVEKGILDRISDIEENK